MFGWDDLIGAGLKILDKVIPDPAQKAAAQLQLLQLNQAGELAEMQANLALVQGQMDTNKVEAASSSLWVSGWRPFIGWACGAAFSMNYVIGPVGEWISILAGHPAKFPQMDITTMMPVLLGMLGLGGLRTTEKIKGVA
jgi:Holin of 3TMs, for gene-transfer release